MSMNGETEIMDIKVELATHGEKIVTLFNLNAQTVGSLQEVAREMRATNSELQRLCFALESFKPLRDDVSRLEAEVASLKETRTTAMGGWKALGLMLGGSATVVGAVAAIVKIIH